MVIASLIYEHHGGRFQHRPPPESPAQPWNSTAYKLSLPGLQYQAVICIGTRERGQVVLKY